MAKQSSSSKKALLDEEPDFINDAISIDLLHANDSFGFDQSIDPAPELPKNPRHPDKDSTFVADQDQTPTQKKKTRLATDSTGETLSSNKKPCPPPHTPRQASMSDKWKPDAQRNNELRRERDWLREMNEILEEAADHLENVKKQFQNVQDATETSHRLLDLYSQILTQSEHTRELLADPNWQGLAVDLERQAEARRAEKLRLKKEREEEEERELLRKKQEEQEEMERQRKRELAANPKSRSFSFTRGSSSLRGRGSGLSSSARPTGVPRVTTTRGSRGQTRIGRYNR